MASSAQKRVGSVSKEGGTLLGDAVEVIAGGVASFGTVYMGMENAAKTLAKDIANDTCRFVDHRSVGSFSFPIQTLRPSAIGRYGAEMARVTKDGMYAVGHGGMTAWNVTELGPKAIAKRTAKKAGLSLLSDLGSDKAPKPGPDAPDADAKEPPPRPPPPAPSS